ncbi:MAG: hypothetical protein J5884_05250 [Paludibacteraceae bacterium]|nr:hypothetical protein [Paludibacteraceae bacterium]
MRKTLILIGLLCLCVQLAAAKMYEQVVLYPSVDQHGDSIILSGKVSVPLNKSPQGIILLSHFTIGADKEAPSRCQLYEQKQLGEDFILIMPDYIGYGVTADRFPPYLHGALTAQNCVDMLPSALRILDSLQVGIALDSLYVMGFSQGGAAALWTLKHLEEHYADRYYVKCCFCGSGPYDVAATYDVGAETNKAALPMSVPLLVMGTSEAYDLNLARGYFFTRRMNKLFDPLIASKRYKILNLYLRMPQHRLDYWLNPAARDKNQPETRRLYEGLMRSSIVHFPMDDSLVGADTICPDWTPQTPLYVFHSYKDEIVPFVNAEHLQRCMSELPNITYDFGDFGGHLQSAYTFIQHVKEKLIP